MVREEVEERLKWRVEDMFPSDEDWEKLYDKVAASIDLSAYAGKLGDKKTLLKVLKLTDELSLSLNKLAIYANLRRDEDNRVSKYSAYFAKIIALYSNFSASFSFFEPEMASFDDKYLKSLIADKDFADYDYMIKRIIDRKPHVASKEVEKVMGLSGEVFGSFQDIYGMIGNADLPLPDIELDGKTIRLAHGVYGSIMQSGDREKRKEAYEKYSAAYKSLINTITSNYYGSVKCDVLTAKVYNFASSLECALFSEDVDRSVYDNLLCAVDESLPVMHRYVADRKKIMGLDKLYFYDINAPLVEGVKFGLPYDEAYGYVVEGLACLGKEYQQLLKKAHDERWVDVEETEGKTRGAYSAGCLSVHPYVLLNYRPELNDMFTIAHEMGHSMHSYFSGKNQPVAKAEYKIFVAEVASTVNEVLLLKYMLEKADDPAMKKYLLNYYLNTIRTTLYRQAMFAEFEYEAHDFVEKGEPLTRELLCDTYQKIGRKYYGNAIEYDDNIAIEWARVPHFYNAFYVYKYATGITAAINIAKRILTEGERAVKDYFKFLSSGGSADPVSLLKLAGVDLSTKQPFEVAVREFAETLTKFEKLMNI